MFEKVRRYIEEMHLLAVGDSVVVAVSGGADSVALLDVLVHLTDLRLRLMVAHLNHALRGRESDEDEAFVHSLAARYGLPVVSKTVDVKALGQRERLSLEDAGRRARYAFFDEVAARNGARCIALGHHGDDQAETVLMRLLRGSGTAGLCAIAPCTAAGRYVRPLLTVTRTEIEAYLLRCSLSFRVDRSNTDTRLLRNRIRHELLPTLHTYNPAISERLAVTAELLQEDEALLERLATEAFARHRAGDAGEQALVVSGLRQEQRGLRLRLYRHALLLARGDLQRISSRHLFAIDRMILHDRPQAALDLPDGLRVERCYDRILFRRDQGEEEVTPYAFPVTGSGTYPLPGGGNLTVSMGASPLASGNRLQACFDLHKAPFPWLVRSFLPGDRFAPFGMCGSKKVKKLFIDNKVPSAVRLRIPLLFCGPVLLWVAGMRKSSVAGVDAATQAPVCVEIRDFALLRT